MTINKLTYCKRTDVGVIYHCGSAGYWRRCRHYEETPFDGICKWYSYARGSSCLNKEAQAEADKLNAEMGGKAE
jgi:hypothetical protein